MDVNEATVAGNVEALKNLFQQAGIGSTEEQSTGQPTPPQPLFQDVGNHVILVHGDLSTAEQVDSLLHSRGAEETPWRRFQSVVFVMGLFHLKMACADAIWKICIQPKAAQIDPTSLMKEITKIRPKEAVKIGSKPGFRRMHEVIQHVGIVSRLDCWRVEVERSYGFASLEDWGKSGVQWDKIQEIAEKLVLEYVAGPKTAMARTNAPEHRDQQNENAKHRQRLYLHYDEMSRSMNVGDIGRVEECFLPWILIFRGCGKHKYAAHMQRFLYNLHFTYPERLSWAIRMNMLCNPTGTPDGFRGIDWWLEHNNFYTKVIYGGQFSNRTLQRILLESVLIVVFKRIRISFENMFALHQRSYIHSPAEMEQTFKILAKQMEENHTHKFREGRTAEYIMPDIIDIGLHRTLSGQTETEDEGPDEGGVVLDAEDGDLDV
ncbi:hypothetical protein CERSUDRAFT_59156 [Gelatoporia subvermispora B]|uniref:DUF6589 domain-containing protein n=1 Tax=Ceriporiopsis subvermispora (strain B) TaxID=914234 RepID=M2QZX4_CERS8|nr:hypothetical protein CERSUDRAFT_59156 [Gelatoporia subvermispora B]